MKKTLIAILAGFALLLSGCAAPGAAPTPAQILSQLNTQVCPGLVAAGPILTTLPGVSDTDKALLAKASADVSKVCAAGATLNPADLQTLAASSLPVVLGIVQALPAFPQQAAIVTGIGAAQILLPILIAQVKAIVPTSPAPDAGTPAAATIPPAATTPA
ncbi:MAG: hypothetical protein JWP38_3762 [Herbaspirillum sp.]|nr:hypothetical protein [Herbaspirillum sp.]